MLASANALRSKVKAPSPQNRVRLKKFLMANPWYPGAKAKLLRIVLQEQEIAFRASTVGAQQKRMEMFQNETTQPVE